MDNCRFSSILGGGAKIALSLALSVALVRGVSADTLLDFNPAESADTETTFFNTTRGMVENTSDDVWHQIANTTAAAYTPNQFVKFSRSDNYGKIMQAATWTELEQIPMAEFSAKFAFNDGEYSQNKFVFGYWYRDKLGNTGHQNRTSHGLEGGLNAGIRIYDCWGDANKYWTWLAVVVNGKVVRDVDISAVFEGNGYLPKNEDCEVEWTLSLGSIVNIRVNGVLIKVGDGDVYSADGTPLAAEGVTLASDSVFAVGILKNTNIKRIKVAPPATDPLVELDAVTMEVDKTELTAKVPTLGNVDSAELYLSYGLPGGERMEQFMTTVTDPGYYSVVPANVGSNTEYEYNFIIKWDNGASSAVSSLGTFRAWYVGGLTAIKFGWIDDGNTATTFYGTKRGLSVNVPGGSWRGATDTGGEYTSKAKPVKLIGNGKVAAALPLCTAGGIPGVPTAFRIRAAFSFQENHYYRNELDIGLWDEAAVARTSYTRNGIDDYSLAQGMDFGVRVHTSMGTSYNSNIKCVHLGLVANKALVSDIDITGRFTDKHILNENQRHEIEYEVDVAAGTLGHIKFDGEAVEGGYTGITFAIDPYAMLGLGVVRNLYLHELEVWAAVEHEFGVTIGGDAASGTVSAEVTASVDLEEEDEAELWVAWGPTGGALTNQRKVGDITSVGEYKAVITGLTPEQDYDYQFIVRKSGEEKTSEVASFRTAAVTLDKVEMTQLEDGSRKFKVDLNGVGASGTAALKLKLAGANGYEREILLGTVSAGGTYETGSITLGEIGAFTWWFELDYDDTTTRTEAKPAVSATLAENTLKSVLSFEVTDDGGDSEVMYGTSRGLAVNLTESEWLKPKTSMTDDNAQYKIANGYARLKTDDSWNWSAALSLGGGVCAKRLPKQLRVSTTFALEEEYYEKDSYMVAFFPEDKLGVSWGECIEANAKLVAAPDVAVRILTHWRYGDKYTFVEVIADGRVCNRTDISYLFPDGAMVWNRTNEAVSKYYTLTFDIDVSLGVLFNLSIDGAMVPEAVGSGVSLSKGCCLGFSALRANNRIRLRTFDVKGVLNTGMILSIR